MTKKEAPKMTQEERQEIERINALIKLELEKINLMEYAKRSKMLIILKKLGLDETKNYIVEQDGTLKESKAK